MIEKKKRKKRREKTMLQNFVFEILVTDLRDKTY